ncbi:MAG: SseB family protein [Pseudomonadota bacterium]
MSATRLDQAHAAMETGGDAARLSFYEALADADLVVLLKTEPEGDMIEPAIAETDEGRYVLAFDGEDRLAAFTGQAAPYAGLPGRSLVEMLAGQGLGLGLNLDVAPSSILLPADAVDWLAQLLSEDPEVTQARPVAFSAPQGLSEALLTGLEGRLQSAAGLAAAAYLAQAQYEDGTSGPLLAFLGAKDAAHPSLAKAVAEALVFSGMDAGAIDVVFLEPGTPALPALVRQGLAIAIPEPEPKESVQVPKPPGSDGPPRLR